MDEIITFTKRITQVPEVKQVQDMFVKVKQWDAQIAALTKSYPVDLTNMRAEIEKAKAAVPKDFHISFEHYLEQIKSCEKWISDANELVENKGTQEEAHRLIQLVENDTEGEFKMIDLDLYARVKAYCFAKIFDFSNKKEKIPSAREFIKYIKSNIPKDLQIDTNLVQDEIKIADLARRIKNWETRNLEFEITHDEARSILEEDGATSLPFVVDDEIKDKFKPVLANYI